MSDNDPARRMGMRELHRAIDTTPGSDLEWQYYADERNRRWANARRWDLVEEQLDSLIARAHAAHEAGEVEITLHTGDLFRIAELASIPDEFPDPGRWP